MKRYVGILEKQVNGEKGGVGPVSKRDGRKARGALSDVPAMGAQPEITGPIHRRGSVEKAKKPEIGRSLWTLEEVPYLRGGVDCAQTKGGGVRIRVNCRYWRKLWKIARDNHVSDPVSYLVRVAMAAQASK
jgi:hypothetical protein